MTERVLVVDDSSFQRTVVRDALQGPFDVVGEAENGAEAVDLFEAYEPDAVVVMCTSGDQEEQMMEAVKAGADGYVTKPVDPDELVPELRGQLR